MKNLFLCSDGDLVRNDKPMRTIRKHYSGSFARIENTLQMRATLRARQWAWPGGYQMYLFTSDGECLCFACARKEYKQISASIHGRVNDGWRVVGCDINYENEITCAHCNEPIPAAYGETEKEVTS